MGKGGFADDSEIRSELLFAGFRRCDPTGFLPLIIVGDTHRDLEAAHSIGAKCIGVPYRHNTVDILTRAGADAVVDNLDGTLAEVVRQLFSSIQVSI
jgi:phosphoglycolate phosphatase-like HAD superfamily hydrolase